MIDKDKIKKIVELQKKLANIKETLEKEKLQKLLEELQKLSRK